MQVLTRLTVATVTGGVLLSGLPAAADHQHLPSGRRVTPYTVKSGDTATGLAVRFHAWTAELISYNHLGRRGSLHVGQRIKIPVVLAALPKNKRHPKKHQAHQHTKKKHHAPAKHTKTKKKHALPDPSRATVRRVVVRTARRHGVDPQLALAICWQESGWQMDRVSSAHAIGAMQVLPATGVWMSMYAGRRLHIRKLKDNVLAGVLLLDVLDDLTRTRKRMIGAYYQGLGAVREHGLYSETRRYVRNVVAIERRLERGLPPS
jgi:LysM repeat protein